MRSSTDAQVERSGATERELVGVVLIATVVCAQQRTGIFDPISNEIVQIAYAVEIPHAADRWQRLIRRCGIPVEDAMALLRIAGGIAADFTWPTRKRGTGTAVEAID